MAQKFLVTPVCIRNAFCFSSTRKVSPQTASSQECGTLTSCVLMSESLFDLLDLDIYPHHVREIGRLGDRMRR